MRGVTNVMRQLGMLPMRKTEKALPEPLTATTTTWVRAPASGIVRSRVKLGQRVNSGEPLITISDPFGDSESVVTAPFWGITIGQTKLPLEHEGDALIHIARFDSVALAEDRVEEFRSDIWPPNENI